MSIILNIFSENTQVVTPEDSLSAIKLPAVMKYMFNFFDRRFNDMHEIAEQIIIILSGVGPADNRIVNLDIEGERYQILYSHLMVSLTVILSHYIDDMVDRFMEDDQKNWSYLVNACLITLNIDPEEHVENRHDKFLDATEVAYLEVIDILLGSDSNISAKRVLDYILDYTDDGGERYLTFFVSTIKLIIVGLILTDNKRRKGSPYIDQYTFNQTDYREIYLNLISGELRKKINYEGYPTEVIISKGSSLLGWFSAVEGDPGFNRYFHDVFDGIMGPMVFLNNYGLEREDQEIRFFSPNGTEQPPATTQDYLTFVYDHWKAVDDFIRISGFKSNGELKPAIKRKLIQFCLAHIALQQPNTNHQYKNFKYYASGNDPDSEVVLIDHSSLEELYQNIFNDILINEWVTEEELVQAVRAIFIK